MFFTLLVSQGAFFTQLILFYVELLGGCNILGDEICNIFLEVPYLKTSIFELVSIDVDKCLKVVVVWYDTIIINKWLFSKKKMLFRCSFFRQGKLLIKCAAQCTVNSSYICKSVITTIVTIIFFWSTGRNRSCIWTAKEKNKLKTIEKFLCKASLLLKALVLHCYYFHFRASFQWAAIFPK